MDALPPGAVLLRPLTPADVPALAALAQEQGRNVSSGEYERFFALEGARGFGVERDGVLLGAATALRYYEHAFLGPVVLRAGSDSAGLTVALLAHLIEALQREGVHAVEAEASAAEEPVLARMGFEILRRTAILEREAAGVLRDGSARQSVPMERDHILDVGSLDADAVGYGRKDYLVSLLYALRDGARVLEREGDVIGFALLRRTARGYQLGPVVTRDDDPESARALARDAAVAAGDASVIALLPAESALVALLEEDGFAPVGALARMRAAARPAPAESATAREWVLGGRMTG